MNENQIIEKIAQDLCHKGGNCLGCNAASNFECTAKKCAKKLYDLGYAVPDEHGNYYSKKGSF